MNGIEFHNKYKDDFKNIFSFWPDGRKWKVSALYGVEDWVVYCFTRQQARDYAHFLNGFEGYSNIKINKVAL